MTMMIFILRAFETINYETHTIFHASSLEKARELTIAFVEEAIEYARLLERAEKAESLVNTLVREFELKLKKELVSKERKQIHRKLLAYDAELTASYPEIAQERAHRLDYTILKAFGISSDTDVNEKVNELISTSLVAVELDTISPSSVVDGD